MSLQEKKIKKILLVQSGDYVLVSFLNIINKIFQNILKYIKNKFKIIFSVLIETENNITTKFSIS